MEFVHTCTYENILPFISVVCVYQGERLESSTNVTLVHMAMRNIIFKVVTGV